MTKTIERNEMRVEVLGVSLGKKAMSATVRFDLAKKNPKSDVANIWHKYRTRRLIGSLHFGSDEPSQSHIEGAERLVLRGSFDSHKPSFDDETADLKLTFDENEVDETDLIRFRYSDAWLCIEEIVDIPPPIKGAKKVNTWSSSPLGLVGLDGPLFEKLTDARVENVGDLVDLLQDEFPLQSVATLKIKGRVAKIVEKLELFFEEQGVESPLG